MAAPTRNRPAVPANQLASLVYNAGGRGDGQVTAVATILRESGGRPDAYRPEAPDLATYNANKAKYNKPGRGNDRGAAQFNDKSHPDVPDADAYDPARAVAHMARKTAGFTNFGTWDMGPNAYSGNDKLPALMASDEWSTARNAVTNPAPYRPAEAEPPPEPLTAGEQDAFERALAKVPGGREEAAVIARYYGTDGTAGIAGTQLAESYGLTAADVDLLRRGLGVNADTDPLWADIGEAGIGVVGALTPGWMDSLGTLLSTLLSSTWWRRILIILGGVALIVLAIVLANRETIVGSVP